MNAEPKKAAEQPRPSLRKALKGAPQRLWRLIYHNWPWKLLALFLALCLWAGLITQDPTLTRERVFTDVTVSVVGADTLRRNSGLIVLSGLEDENLTARMRVDVPQREYNTVTASNYNPRVDLTRITEAGEQTLRINTTSTSTYGTVRGISPETITVVAQEGEEALPSAISLGTIELEDVLGDTSYSFPIKLPAGVTAWGEQSRYARVSLTFPQLVTRQLAVEQIALQNIPQGYDAALVSKQLYVWVRGRQDLVEALDPNQLQVEVDLSEAGKGDELQRFPAKVTWKGGEPEGVKIMGTHYSVALRLKQ